MRKVKKYILKINENNYTGILAYSKDESPIVSQTGFETHSEAEDWLDSQIKEKDLSYDFMSFQKLANILVKNPKNNQVKNILEMKIEMLKEQMFFTFVVKEDVSEKEAKKRVNQLCGHNWSTSFDKAKDNTLDALISLDNEKTQERLEKLLDSFNDLNYQGSQEAKEVLSLINKVPGKKILTIHLDHCHVFDIDENGVVGYESGHENLLLKQIDKSFKERNAFIVRQFIPNSEKEVVLKNGKKIMMPWKALYSFVIDNYRVVGMSAEELEYSSTHDTEDNFIGVEDFVIFKDMSEFFK